MNVLSQPQHRGFNLVAKSSISPNVSISKTVGDVVSSLALCSNKTTAILESKPVRQAKAVRVAKSA